VFIIKEIFKRDDGQVALVVLLVSALMLTLGLSAAKQTTIETKIDTDEELLKQAFNAAESGIDYYLGTGKTTYSSPDLRTTAEISSRDIGNSQVLTSDGVVLSSEPFFFWLVNHDESGGVGSEYYSGSSLNLCVDDGYNKALKVDYFYLDNLGNYKVLHSGYNFDSDNAKLVVGFTDKVGAGGCVDVSLSAGDPLLLVVTPIGGQTRLQSRGSNFFPIQGMEITSVGKAGDVSAEVGSSVNTKVSIINRYELPAFMLEAVTSGGSVN